MKIFIKDIKKYIYYAVYAAKVDLKSEVANSYLNWVWWILEPLCEMLIFTFVFGVLFANSEKYFPVFIYSGLIMWNFFSRTITYSVGLIRKNKGIITKVYLPKFILLLENMLLNMTKLLISWSILIVMMIMYRVQLSLKMLYIIPVYAIFFIFCFGCGMIFLHFGVFIDDLSYAVSILLRLLFYVSGVFYNIAQRFPYPQGKIMEVFNPIAMLMNAMHNALLYNISPDFKILLLWLIISLLLCGIGIRVIYKYENSYVKAI